MNYAFKAGSVSHADAPREEQELIRRVKEALDAFPDLPKASDWPLLSVQSVLDEPEPIIDTERRIPLTW